MRDLLDEQLPRQLARELVGHDVETVQRRGWAGIKNGPLLALAADEGFDVFLSKDTGVEYQQNLAQVRVEIVVLDAPSHDIDVLRPLVPGALEAIAAVRPGEVRHVGPPE